MREPTRDTYEGRDPLVADPLPDDWDEATAVLKRRLQDSDEHRDDRRRPLPTPIRS